MHMSNDLKMLLSWDRLFMLRARIIFVFHERKLAAKIYNYFSAIYQLSFFCRIIIRCFLIPLFCFLSFFKRLEFNNRASDGRTFFIEHIQAVSAELFQFKTAFHPWGMLPDIQVNFLSPHTATGAANYPVWLDDFCPVFFRENYLKIKETFPGISMQLHAIISARVTIRYWV